MTVFELDLGIILDFVQKHYSTVWQKPGVHGRDTRLTHDLESAWYLGGRGGYRARCVNDSRSQARAILTAVATMRGIIAAELGWFSTWA